MPPSQTTKSAPSAAPPQLKKPQGAKKWEGEDDEDADEPVVRPSFSSILSFIQLIEIILTQSDWEESSDEEEEDVKPAAASAPAPLKKKGTLKQKLAEKEAAAKASKANGKSAHADDDDSSEEYDSDAVLDPREKARREKEREVKADLKNAADLFGSVALGGRCNLIDFSPVSHPTPHSTFLFRNNSSAFPPTADERRLHQPL